MPHVQKLKRQIFWGKADCCEMRTFTFPPVFLEGKNVGIYSKFLPTVVSTSTVISTYCYSSPIMTANQLLLINFIHLLKLNQVMRGGRRTIQGHHQVLSGKSFFWTWKIIWLSVDLVWSTNLHVLVLDLRGWSTIGLLVSGLVITPRPTIISHLLTSTVKIAY